MTDLAARSGEAFCYLTTRGRVSARPHTIEIWFAISGRTLYLLSGGGRRSDWVRNLEAEPRVRVRIADLDLAGRARVVTDPAEVARARSAVHNRYARGDELLAWRDASLPVAIDLDPA